MPTHLPSQFHSYFLYFSEFQCTNNGIAIADWMPGSARKDNCNPILSKLDFVHHSSFHPSTYMHIIHIHIFAIIRFSEINWAYHHIINEMIFTLKNIVWKMEKNDCDHRWWAWEAALIWVVEWMRSAVRGRPWRRILWVFICKKKIKTQSKLMRFH